ncbi:MAG TPA: beta-galactosidase [Saprospiraceae bacterium]|nr:beta-galactosidase [Saprospiraceae bacterium]
MKNRIAFVLLLSCFALLNFMWAQSHQFALGESEFLLDGNPFQMRSGEMHFQRVPKEYWKDRLIKIRALGLNTVSTYVFWNALEPIKSQWNFEEENDLKTFIELAQQLGLYVYLRPGPYVCAEWDGGGLPAWLMNEPKLKIRSFNEPFLKHVKDYFSKLSEIIKPLQISNGGPIILLQIENEFGSFGADEKYLDELVRYWRELNITIPFTTSDGANEKMLVNGTIKDCAVGLDPGSKKEHFDLAKKMNPGVPVFCGEYYPGWLTHWGEKKWASVDPSIVLEDIRWFMRHNLSFNLYVIHGGTNFGWMAGSNGNSMKIEPDVSSYDYGAPIAENGDLRPVYFDIQLAIYQYITDGSFWADPVKNSEKLKHPSIVPQYCGHLYDQLPQEFRTGEIVSMETLNHYYGCILYRTKLEVKKNDSIVLNELHDYASIYIDGKYITSLNRMNHDSILVIEKNYDNAVTLDILVEPFGRINYGREMFDSKGITKNVLINHVKIPQWEIYVLDMKCKHFNDKPKGEPGAYYKAELSIEKPTDCYINMSQWKKGYVWVNGKMLGRFWNIGPQQSLYLPGVWLNKGVNEILIFDYLAKDPKPISFQDQLD